MRALATTRAGAHHARVPQGQAHVRERVPRRRGSDGPRSAHCEAAVIRCSGHVELHMKTTPFSVESDPKRIWCKAAQPRRSQPHAAITRGCGFASLQLRHAACTQSGADGQGAGSRTALPSVRRTRSLNSTFSAQPPTRTSEPFDAPSGGSGRSACTKQNRRAATLAYILFGWNGAARAVATAPCAPLPPALKERVQETGETDGGRIGS